MLLDDLYIDKLDENSTESEYEGHYATLQAKLTEINVKLEQLREAAGKLIWQVHNPSS